ncbi:MAG: hypothetical protein IT378_13275 [Sandaracinaceae bacterium]|nr:hypothetical protein [Sandaracinaceae bacterium]
MLDFRELEYMNSSTVRPIIELLQSANTNASAVRVLYRSGVTWQRLSFRLIEALSKDWGKVTMEG